MLPLNQFASQISEFYDKKGADATSRRAWASLGDGSGNRNEEGDRDEDGTELT